MGGREGRAGFPGWRGIASLRRDPAVKDTGFGTKQTSAPYQDLTSLLGPEHRSADVRVVISHRVVGKGVGEYNEVLTAGSLLTCQEL